MPNLPSIDDLIKKEGEMLASTQEKYKKKMEEIRHEEKEEETKKEAKAQGVPYINLKGFPIAPEILKLLPKEIAQKNNICNYKLI